MTLGASSLTLRLWGLFLAGPVLWSLHFVGVYLLAEAACSADRGERDLLGLPWLATVTLAATIVAVAVATATTVAAYRAWRSSAADVGDWFSGSDLNPGLALAGFLLGILFIVAIIFVGVPAAFLEPC